MTVFRVVMLPQTAQTFTLVHLCRKLHSVSVTSVCVCVCIIDGGSTEGTSLQDFELMQSRQGFRMDK